MYAIICPAPSPGTADNCQTAQPPLACSHERTPPPSCHVFDAGLLPAGPLGGCAGQNPKPHNQLGAVTAGQVWHAGGAFAALGGVWAAPMAADGAAMVADGAAQPVAHCRDRHDVCRAAPAALGGNRGDRFRDAVFAVGFGPGVFERGGWRHPACGLPAGVWRHLADHSARDGNRRLVCGVAIDGCLVFCAFHAAYPQLGPKRRSGGFASAQRAFGHTDGGLRAGAGRALGAPCASGAVARIVRANGDFAAGRRGVGHRGAFVGDMGTALCPLASLAPLQYLEIPVAAVLGLWIFGDWPNALAQLGIAISVSAGLFVMLQARAKPGQTQPAP